MNDENKLARGFYYNPPHAKAPSYVICSVSIRPNDFIGWLEAQQPDAKGYVKLDVLTSKAGKVYAKVNDFVPGQSTGQPTDQKRAQTPDSGSDRVGEDSGAPYDPVPF